MVNLQDIWDGLEKVATPIEKGIEKNVIWLILGGLLGLWLILRILI